MMRNSHLGDVPGEPLLPPMARLGRRDLLADNTCALQRAAGFVSGIVAAFVVAVMLVLLGMVVALARDPDGRYANSPHRDWYQTRELTPAAQKRFSFKSCCAHSDVVRTRFRVTKEGGDGWEYVDPFGQWARVPDDIIHWGADTPTGEPVLFAISTKPTCFFPGKGGI